MNQDTSNKQAELDQRLKDLVDALAVATESVREILARVHASVVQATAELNQIEMFPPPRELLRVSCFDCGKRNLEVFHTSKRHGYHLCPECFGSRERRGMARAAQQDAQPGVPLQRRQTP
jgi:hypothetical protein